MKRRLVLCAAVAAVTALAPTMSALAYEPARQTNGMEGLSAWSGVSWSRVGALPEGVDVSTLSAWDDGYVLIGADRPDRSGRQQAGVWSSTDLSTWSRGVTAGDPDGTTSLTTLVTLPTRLVAFGTEQPASCVAPLETPCDPPRLIAWTSTDGVAWDDITGSAGLGAGIITDVAAGPDQVLAVGDQGWSTPTIWRSADGLQWDVVALPTDTFDDAHLFGVTSFAGGWVVTGMTGGHELRCCADGWMVDETQPAAWWSADGVTWQRATLGLGASEWGPRLGAVFAGLGGLVAVDDGDPVDVTEPVGSPGSSLPIKPRTLPGQPQVWTSSDGRAWTPVSVDPDTAFRPIASDGTAILGRSTHGDLAVSTDGTTWRALDVEGDVPGGESQMDWGYMRPAWLVPAGLVAVGANALGGPTRRLWLAAG